MLRTISRTLAGGAAISIVLVIILSVVWLGSVGCARKGIQINGVNMIEVRGYRRLHTMPSVIAFHDGCI